MKIIKIKVFRFYVLRDVTTHLHLSCCVLFQTSADVRFRFDDSARRRQYKPLSQHDVITLTTLMRQKREEVFGKEDFIYLDIGSLNEGDVFVRNV